MKTTEVQLDLKTQAAILQLGRMLAHGDGGSSPISPEALQAEVERVLALIRTSSARRLFGIRCGFGCADDILRLKTIAHIGWQIIGEANSCNPIDDVVREVMQGDMGPHCERLLYTRDALAKMVCDGLLCVAYDSGEFWGARLSLPKRTYSWLCGGNESKGDFDPGKIAIGRLNRGLVQVPKAEAVPLHVPTAKQIYEAVRREVVGLDSQVRVLASRIALHVARAELLKAGKQDQAVGNTVVLLAGNSGSGKSYIVERTAAAAALPFCQIDATTLTASGYVGSDVDEIYKLLVNATNGDAVAASRGLCFIDEFDKKSTRYARGGADCRDVGGESVQMELLSKLQASTTPFVVGGKRGSDGRSFLFDGRPTGYILAGVFAGLDEAAEKLAGRQGIGYASEAGSRQHVRISDCLKSLGFIDELVNRVSLVIRLPDPTIENVIRATAGGILEGFNLVLAVKGIVLLPTDSAIRAIGDYSMQTKAFFRGAKAVLSVLAEEQLFDPRKGTVIIEATDVRRAVDRLSSGFIDPESMTEKDGLVPFADGEFENQAEEAVAKVSGGG